MRQNIGSGIVIDTAGHIVTTTFEMGPPSKIEVIFNNKRVSSAKLIGTDVFTDIAVLRATGPLRESTPPTDAVRSPAVPEEWIEFTLPRKWGDSSKIDTGSWVVTIGSSYGQSPLSPSVLWAVGTPCRINCVANLLKSTRGLHPATAVGQS